MAIEVTKVTSKGSITNIDVHDSSYSGVRMNFRCDTEGLNVLVTLTGRYCHNGRCFTRTSSGKTIPESIQNVLMVHNWLPSDAYALAEVVRKAL